MFRTVLITIVTCTLLLTFKLFSCIRMYICKHGTFVYFDACLGFPITQFYSIFNILSKAQNNYQPSPIFILTFFLS